MEDDEEEIAVLKRPAAAPAMANIAKRPSAASSDVKKRPVSAFKTEKKPTTRRSNNMVEKKIEFTW